MRSGWLGGRTGVVMADGFESDTPVRALKPIVRGTPLESLLVFLIGLVNVATPLASDRGGNGRWKQARVEARTFVADSWGPELVVAKRLERRKFLHGVLIVLFVTGAVPSLAIYFMGTSTGLDWLRIVGGIALGIAAIPLGLDGPVIVRGYFMTMDFYRWRAAGRPDRWHLTPASQLRSRDLVWAALLAAVLVWFFIRLALG